jgi:hypothetical protein
MEIDEGRRHRMVERFTDVFGSEVTDTVMAYFPPGGWGEVATRGDLAELRGEMRAQMAELRGDLRGEMADLRDQLRTGMAELSHRDDEARVELHKGFGELRREVRSQLLGQMTLTVAYGAALVAAVRIH